MVSPYIDQSERQKYLMRNMVKQPTKQEAQTKNVNEDIFSRVVFRKNINQINNYVRRNNYVILLKYGQNCGNSKV